MRIWMSLLLGGWLLGTLLVAGVAAENFFMIDRLLHSSAHPSFESAVAALPSGEARAMLRYLSSELNRYYFEVWGWMQLGLALPLLAGAFKLRQRKLVIGFSLMLPLVAVMIFYLTPQIVSIGRSLDFVPREPPPPGLAAFGRLHAAYSFLDLALLLAGGWMAVGLIRNRTDGRERD